MLTGSVRQVPWPRIVAEAVAIVASILLAFAIDAWWQDRSQRLEARDLAAKLHADFRESQAHLEDWRAGSRRIHSGTGEFLDLLKRADKGQELEVPLRLVVAAIGAPTYSPTDAAVELLSSAGEARLNENLHNALARWRQQIADTSEDELLIRGIVVNHLVPELSRQARLAAAFEYERITGHFAGRDAAASDEFVSITVTPMLEAALAERHFYSTFVVEGLDAIYQTQAQILEFLEHF
jgi:hypothetical protein